MIRILYRDKIGNVLTDLPLGKLGEALEKRTVLLWVDFDAESIPTIEPYLNDTFGFHPLAVDDALHESHVPKVDDWQEYLYVVMRAVAYASGHEEQLEIPELDVFLGPTYCVTYHRETISALDQVWAVCQSDERWLKRGAAHLLYRLADQLMSDAVTSAEHMHEDLDKLEDQIFAAIEPDTLSRLFTLKREILQLRRIVTPSRDVFNKLSRNGYAVLDDADRLFFRDVYDHLLQLEDLLDDMLILVGSALDTYLSVVNNRMNDIMKTLTVITAFFMPLAFITGFFGMNFFQAAVPLEAWTGQLAFVVVMLAMALIPLIMFLWMRHRSWI
jgi:magnesium transporter